MVRRLTFGAVAILLGLAGACEDEPSYGDGDDDGDGDSCGVLIDENCDDGSGAGSGNGATTGNGATNGATSGGGGDGTVQQQCVDIINNYRASVGRPPLARWTSAESCSDAEALSDGQSDTPHGAFGMCGEFAQNECPGWPGPESELIVGCLDLMWDEGPGGGHYDNMENPQYTEVACGFATMSDGSIWAVQNFR